MLLQMNQPHTVILLRLKLGPYHSQRGSQQHDADQVKAILLQQPQDVAECYRGFTLDRMD
jgi:hypothetical protein